MKIEHCPDKIVKKMISSTHCIYSEHRTLRESASPEATATAIAEGSGGWGGADLVEAGDLLVGVLGVRLVALLQRLHRRLQRLRKGNGGSDAPPRRSAGILVLVLDSFGTRTKKINNCCVIFSSHVSEFTIPVWRTGAATTQSTHRRI